MNLLKFALRNAARECEAQGFHATARAFRTIAEQESARGVVLEKDRTSEDAPTEEVAPPSPSLPQGRG